MKSLVVLLLLFASTWAIGQEWQWQNLYSTHLYRQGKIAVDAEGNVYSLVTWNNHLACMPDPLGVCPDQYVPQYTLLLVKTNPEGLMLNMVSKQEGQVLGVGQFVKKD